MKETPMEIYVFKHDRQKGPYTLEEIDDQLEKGFLQPTDLAWHDGLEDWKKIEVIMGRVPSGSGGPKLPPSPYPLNVRTSGLAIASLVCGILSLLTGVTALLGLPLGIFALIRIRNSKGEFKGSGLAIAGIVCSCIGGLMLMVLVLMLMPALGKAKSRANRIKCVSNLKQISTSLKSYASDNDDNFPWQRKQDRAPIIGTTHSQVWMSVSRDLGNPKLLRSPCEKERTEALSFSALTTGNLTTGDISYWFCPIADELMPATCLVGTRNIGTGAAGTFNLPNTTTWAGKIMPGLDSGMGQVALSDGSSSQYNDTDLSRQLNAHMNARTSVRTTPTPFIIVNP